MDNTLLKSVLIASALSAGILAGCSSDDDDANPLFTTTTDEASNADGETDPATSGEFTLGLTTVDSVRSVPEAIGELEISLDGNTAIKQLPAIDHQANADAIGETLRPTTVKLFGNPELGTPLMQVNQLAGLDLPQKILAWENENQTVRIGYNSASYLRDRHAIVGADEALTGIDNALAMLAGNAAGATSTGAGSDVDSSADSGVKEGEGIITVNSTQDMDTTYTSLVSSIENAEPLMLVAQVDHSANAEEAGLTPALLPTRLVIFGNPVLGTPLMQASQTLAIDLPQKMLVFENAAGEVTIAYNDPVYLAARHGFTGQDEVLDQVSTALAALADGAANAEQ